MEITKREIYNFKERKFPEKICFEPIGIIHKLTQEKEFVFYYDIEEHLNRERN